MREKKMDLLHSVKSCMGCKGLQFAAIWCELWLAKYCTVLQADESVRKGA